jgi:hypothetical protein
MTGSSAEVVRLTLADVKPMSQALENIGQFKKQAALAFGPRGLSLTTVDDNHVMLIALALHAPDAAVAYSPPAGGGHVSFRVDLKSASSVLKLGLKRGEAAVMIKEGSETLDVALENTEFKIPPLPMSGQAAAADVPELEPPSDPADVVLTLCVKEAKRLFKEFLAFGGDVGIAFSPEAKAFRISCTGPKGVAVYDIMPGSAGVRDVADSGRPYEAQRFDAAVLNKLVKADVGNKEVLIALRAGLPLEVRHPLGGSSSLAFHLAPKH